MVLLWGRHTAASGQLLVVIGLRTPELLSFLPEEKTQKCTCRLSTRRVKAELPRAVAALMPSDFIHEMENHPASQKFWRKISSRGRLALSHVSIYQYIKP